MADGGFLARRRVARLPMGLAIVAEGLIIAMLLTIASDVVRRRVEPGNAGFSGSETGTALKLIDVPVADTVLHTEDVAGFSAVPMVEPQILGIDEVLERKKLGGPEWPDGPDTGSSVDGEWTAGVGPTDIGPPDPVYKTTTPMSNPKAWLVSSQPAVIGVQAQYVTLQFEVLSDTAGLVTAVRLPRQLNRDFARLIESQVVGIRRLTPIMSNGLPTEGWRRISARFRISRDELCTASQSANCGRRLF